MEPEERIRKAIQDIAQHRKNVAFSDIEWVIRQLESYYPVRQRKTRHGILFGIKSHRFMVNVHNPGSSQVKAYCVDDFIEAMEGLGLYNE